MKLENTVCTKEQGKRLLELGITAESLYYHYEAHINGEITFPVVNINNWHYGSIEENSSIRDAVDGSVKNEAYPAFTVSELGIMLPTIGFEYCKSNSNGEDFFWLTSNYWRVKGVRYENKIEAHCRAEMIIYLLAAGHVAASDINSRLINS